MFDINNNEFTQALESNLATYLTSSNDDINLFSTRKEISIARYALSAQALAYQTSMSILFDLLDNVRNTINDNNHKAFTDIMTMLASIEAKSRALIESAQKVTQLLGEAVKIDVDKSALRTLLLNTPALLEETITTVSGDSQLASKISFSFNAKINELMIACRLNRDELVLNGQTQQNGIDIDDYYAIINSIPSQPNMQQELIHE